MVRSKTRIVLWAVYIAWLLGGGFLARKCLSYAGLVFFLALTIGIRSRWEFLFRRAGPRTSRQVPPQRIPKCLQLSATKLHEAFREGSLTSLQVTAAYIEHIKNVNPYLNLLVFDCFDEAIAAAKAADAAWAAWRRNGRKSSETPSFVCGVPCTIKECMLCTGCPNTSGNPARANVISPRDSHVVGNFRKAGAVILGVTNTSELCMWYESSNYIYGISCNPFDTRCLVGGSSGGEGAAAGAAFACFGIGSDIGGSIRMPAFFNGVYGLKATPHMICNEGQHPGAKSSANHFMATGPLTRFAEDVLPLAKIAAQGGFGMDPVLFPPASPLSQQPKTPWDTQAFVSERNASSGDSANPHKPLRIYALEDYGVPLIQVSDAQKQAVRVAAAALARSKGAELFYVNCRDPSRCTGGEVPKPFRYFPEALSYWSDALTSDPSEASFMSTMAEDVGDVWWFFELIRWMFGFSVHTLPAIMLCVIETVERHLPKIISIGHVGNLRFAFQQELEELLGDDSIIIAPTFPTAAPRHHFPLWNPMQFQYTAVFNVLQLPAVACPVWYGEEVLGSRTAPTSEFVRECHLSPDAHLPKGVQLVGKRNTDEMLIGLANTLDRVLGGYRYPGWAILEE
eukprot:gene7599-5360_t